MGVGDYRALIAALEKSFNCDRLACIGHHELTVWSVGAVRRLLELEQADCPRATLRDELDALEITERVARFLEGFSNIHKGGDSVH